MSVVEVIGYMLGIVLSLYLNSTEPVPEVRHNCEIVIPHDEPTAVSAI